MMIRAVLNKTFLIICLISIVGCSTPKPPEVVIISPTYPIYGDTPMPRQRIEVWSDLLLWKAEAEALIRKSNVEKRAIYAALKKE